MARACSHRFFTSSSDNGLQSVSCSICLSTSAYEGISAAAPPFPLLTTNPPFFLLSNTHFHFRLSTSPGGHNNNSRKINQSREIQRESHENRETLRGFGFPVHLGLGGTTTSVSLLHTCITFLYTRKAEEETVAERRDDDASEEDAKRDQPGNAVVGEGGQSRDTQGRQWTPTQRAKP